MKKKNGFTLIELLAVVAILAILALISIPMVQDYVDKAEIKARDVNARNLLRAADNYYSYVNMEMGTEYPIVLDLPSDELKLSGGQPDSGQIIIYEDGSVYIEAIYGDDLYIKQTEQTSFIKGKIVVGDYLLWSTDGDGTITHYNLAGIVEEEFKFIEEIINLSIDYATRGDSYDIDYSKSLKQNYNTLSEGNKELISIMDNILPKKIKDEIDYMLEKFNTSSAVTDEETLISMFSNDNDLSYMWEVVSAMIDEVDLMETEIYSLLIKEVADGNLDTITVPNYVKDEDGNLEKITTIGNGAFWSEASINNLLDCTIAPNKATDKGKNVIISNGIETIKEGAFAGCMIESVQLPETIKIIENIAFSYNRLKTIKLPSKIQYVSGFSNNDLKGEIIIPNTVIEIGGSAFESLEIESDNTLCSSSYEHMVKLCNGMQGVKNEIEKVTFQKGSKIEKIGSYAFDDNKLATVTIPKSIKEIGHNAFHCATLTSAHIERAQGADLVVADTAFGSIVPTYGN